MQVVILCNLLCPSLFTTPCSYFSQNAIHDTCLDQTAGSLVSGAPGGCWDTTKMLWMRLEDNKAFLANRGTRLSYKLFIPFFDLSCCLQLYRSAALGLAFRNYPIRGARHGNIHEYIRRGIHSGNCWGLPHCFPCLAAIAIYYMSNMMFRRGLIKC